MTYKTVKDYFERKPNASYLFFACMIFLFRVFLNWYGNDVQLVTLLDVIWTLMMTAGFVAGDRIRRKNKTMKDKIEDELIIPWISSVRLKRSIGTTSFPNSNWFKVRSFLTI